MTHRDFKDVARRTNSGNILRDKVFNIAKNPKHDGYQKVLASMVYKLLDQKSAGSGVTTFANKSVLNNDHPLDLTTQELATELQKPNL